MTTLYQKKAAIMEAIKELLEADPNLDVTDIVIGERYRSARPPWLWVMMDSLTNTPPASGLAIKETWTGIIHVVSIVKSNDEIEGQAQSQQLAMDASETLMQDRSFKNTVQTSWRAFITPSFREPGEGELLYSSIAEIRAIIYHMVGSC